MSDSALPPPSGEPAPAPRGSASRRMRALVIKEYAQIRRDPSTFLIAFAMPLLLLFLFGYAISLDPRETKIALVVQDESAPAARLAQAYVHSPYFSVTLLRGVAPARALMERDAIRGFVVIPPDFGASMAKGAPHPIQIVTDGTQPNQATFIANYADGVRMNWMASEMDMAGMRGAGPPIDVSQRVWFNPGLHSRFFLVPGAIAVVMTMIGTLLTALVVAREWERGTMEALMATPMRMAEFVASKVLPYFLLGLGSMALCTLIAVAFFGLPFRGSIVALMAIAAAFLLPALGLGLFISATTKNQFVASQMALFSSFLPTFLLSGFIFEIASMPWPIQALTYAVPARYLIPSLQTVFMAGDVWSIILPNIAIMLGFGVLFFLLCFRATRRSLDA
ncbi:ABC transporter permease [Sphingobium lignivorans]|uniref:ABC-2 type transport system permease protein n=1 Tax=Sphingobium lignivorans TaxID=2735886 RepID=A0ABR6NAL7_9SPHN|nr:ABC transporter permease [Sphingobium lignivorans]MBB5984299.1 ABC-2 type transport system permease protein [Sphingobium lignivorans]